MHSASPIKIVTRENKMKIKLKITGGRTIKLKAPPPGVGSIEVPNMQCQHCKEPLRAEGRNPEIGFDTVTSKARCSLCEKDVGTLVVTMDTIFGIEEDERVLHGKPRVY